MDEELKQRIANYADRAYAAAYHNSLQQAALKITEAKARLASRGVILSGATVHEIAGLQGEHINTVVQARADALLDAYELYGAEIDHSILEEATTLRDTLLEAISTNPSSGLPPGVPASEMFRPLLETNTGSIINMIACQIEQRKVIPKFKKTEYEANSSAMASNVDEDRRFALMAIEEARKSVPEDERPHPKVGVIVVKDGTVVSKAYRGENPKSHAEYIALEEKLSDDLVAGATVYTTLEPCTTRNHPKIPCAQRLVERKVARVVIGMLDPNPKIRGLGEQLLGEAGIETQLFPKDLKARVEEINREFIRVQKQKQSPSQSPSFLFVFGAPLGENDSPVWIMMLKHYGANAAYNCDIQFFDDDRKNIEHQWLVEHPGSAFLPPEGVAGKSQARFRIPEGGPEGSIDSFQWTPIDPNNQHYTVSITCREGVFIEKWEVTRVDGVLRTKVTIEHGPQWVEQNPTLSPVVFACTEPGFVSSPLASVLPREKAQPVNPGWKPNHRFEFPVAILDPNGHIQVMSGVRLPDGGQKTDFGCWNLLTKHFGGKP